MKKDITELYCCVEDFCRVVDENFANKFLSNGKKTNQSTRNSALRNANHNPVIPPIAM